MFELRGLSSYFDGGIFGSPDEKEKIVEREKSDKNIIGKSLFLGDSMYDYQVSLTFELDFIFLTQWTDFYGWNEYFKKRGVQTCTNISQLITL